MIIKISGKGISSEYKLDDFNKEVVSFGSNPDCDILIRKKHISDCQGCFYKQNGRWFIKNMDDSNSFRLNKERCDEKIILEGDIFIIKKKKNADEEIRITVKKSVNKKNKRINIALICVNVLLLSMVGIFLIIYLNGRKDIKDDKTTTESLLTEMESLEQDESTEDNDKSDSGTMTDALEYYSNYSDLLSVTKVDEAENVYTEKESVVELESRGFDKYDVESEYDMNGELLEETVRNGKSETKHPIYQTYYESASGDVWIVFLMHNEIIAYPVSYNVESDQESPVVLSEKDFVISYDGISNAYYENIPQKSELIVVNAGRIDSVLLDNMTKEEIDRYVEE
ncbi:MAG: FHA domain-containing protein [Eubacterium sp.]|nr:FHA domain-containing protein [Eubacterium sp.]